MIITISEEEYLENLWKFKKGLIKEPYKIIDKGWVRNEKGPYIYKIEIK